jgi:sec-independent protein translocase protein TatB
MSFGETIFLFFLALVVFGPKKLPEIARQAGRLMAELRRASNEFKAQIEQEIAHIETENARKTLPPAEPPAGSVANHTLSVASSEADHEATETTSSTSAEAAVTTSDTHSVASTSSQESHG